MPSLRATEPQRLNNYSWCANRPVIRIDPNGRDDTKWGISADKAAMSGSTLERDQSGFFAEGAVFKAEAFGGYDKSFAGIKGGFTEAQGGIGLRIGPEALNTTYKLEGSIVSTGVFGGYEKGSVGGKLEFCALKSTLSQSVTYGPLSCKAEVEGCLGFMAGGSIGARESLEMGLVGGALGCAYDPTKSFAPANTAVKSTLQSVREGIEDFFRQAENSLRGMSVDPISEMYDH